MTRISMPTSALLLALTLPLITAGVRHAQISPDLAEAQGTVDAILQYDENATEAHHDYVTAEVTADLAHSYGLDGAGVGIAVIDSGVYERHPDLQGRIVYQESFDSSGSVFGQYDMLAIGAGYLDLFAALNVLDLPAATTGAAASPTAVYDQCRVEHERRVGNIGLGEWLVGRVGSSELRGTAAKVGFLSVWSPFAKKPSTPLRTESLDTSVIGEN